MPIDYLRGPIANVFTAFHEDGAFDGDGQRAILDALLATEAISAYFVRSGMGQMYTFSAEEVKAIAHCACTHMNGKGPVLVGVSGAWDRRPETRRAAADYTGETIRLAQHAQDEGAAGVVITLPEAIGLDEETPVAAESATLRHIEAVGASVSIPVFLYQPPRTGPLFCVTVERLRRIAEAPNVAGIKVSTADAGLILDCVWSTRGMDFVYINGNETAYYAALAMGVKGCIGEGCCLAPKIVRAVLERFEAGDHAGAMDAQRSLNLLVQKNPGAVTFWKRYVAEQGYPVQPWSRDVAGNSYQDGAPVLSEDAYGAFKNVYEPELARY